MTKANQGTVSICKATSGKLNVYRKTL